MNLFTITIQIESQELFPKDTEILFSPEVLKSLGLPLHKQILIGFGTRGTTARVGASSASKSIILMSQSLADRLHIPFDCTLNMSYSQEQTKIEFGPILGVLISRAQINSAEPFGQLTAFCEEACEAARFTNSLCYIVTLDNISIEEGIAQGWTKTNHGWKKLTFPLPNALYNRLSSRIIEKKEHVIKQLQQLKEVNVPIFNDRFLDKWHVYQILTENRSTNQSTYHIPETKLCTNPKMIQLMLSKHPILFLKPIHGSQGRGIVRIQKVKGGYITDHTTLNGLNSYFYKKSSDLIKSLSTKLKKWTYLIQQGIPLIQIGESTIDFRVLLQKDKEGSWRITSLVSRLGNPNTFVSNVAQGGNLMGANQLLKKINPPNHKMPSLNLLKRAALEIVYDLEENLLGHYGELGVDLGIDTTGKVWLIEINSKPSKNEETLLTTAKRPRPSVIHLFDYVYYLAGFTKQNQQGRQRHKVLKNSEKPVNWKKDRR